MSDTEEKLKRLSAIERFEKAVRDHAFIGTQRRGDAFLINVEYERSRAAIYKMLWLDPIPADVLPEG